MNIMKDQDILPLMAAIITWVQKEYFAAVLASET